MGTGTNDAKDRLAIRDVVSTCGVTARKLLAVDVRFPDLTSNIGDRVGQVCRPFVLAMGIRPTELVHRSIVGDLGHRRASRWRASKGFDARSFYHAVRNAEPK